MPKYAYRALNKDGTEVFGIVQDEHTPAKCREYARQYDISVTGEQIERYLKSISMSGN